MARFRFDVLVRWSDQDRYGHVNNAAFVSLFEEARTAWIAGAGGIGDSLLSGADTQTDEEHAEGGLFVRRMSVEYLRPVNYRARPVAIELWVTEMKAAWFELAYEMVDDGSLASRAWTTLVPVDLASGRPRRLSAAERDFLLAHQDGVRDHAAG